MRFGFECLNLECLTAGIFLNSPQKEIGLLCFMLPGTALPQLVLISITHATWLSSFQGVIPDLQQCRYRRDWWTPECDPTEQVLQAFCPYQDWEWDRYIPCWSRIRGKCFCCSEQFSLCLISGSSSLSQQLLHASLCHELIGFLLLSLPENIKIRQQWISKRFNTLEEDMKNTEVLQKLCSMAFIIPSKWV